MDLFPASSLNPTQPVTQPTNTINSGFITDYKTFAYDYSLHIQDYFIIKY